MSPVDAVALRPPAVSAPVAGAGGLARVDVTVARPGAAEWSRMDVAAFVGFARRGPLDVPVEVGDLAGFESVFGGPVRLAVDPGGAARPDADEPGDLIGYLHPAVASYLANGGRTCWVVRVADRRDGAGGGVPRSRAVRARLPVAGTARRVDSGAPGGAWLLAAWAGSSGYEVRLGAAALSRAIAVDDVRVEPGRMTFRLRNGALAPGDLVRCCFGATAPRDGVPSRPAVEVQAVVTGLDAGAQTVVVTTARPLRLTPCPPGPEQDAVLETGRAVRADPALGTLTLPGGLPPGCVPQPGEVVGGRLGDATPFLALVHDARPAAPSVGPSAAPSAGQDGAAVVLGSRFWLTGGEGPERPPERVEVLTLELRTRLAEQGPLEIWSDLGCAPGHDRYVGDLPTDEVLFADAARADRSPSRCPVAGPGDRPVFHPIGLPFPGDGLAVAEAEAHDAAGGVVGAVSTGAVDDGLSAQARDGLDTVTPQTFLDPAVQEVPASNLRAAADDVRARRGEPGPLVGLHTVLDLEAVTLLAVPDAVHVGLRIAAPPVPRWRPPPEQADGGPVRPRHHDPTGGAFVAAGPVPGRPTLHRELDAAGTVRLTWSAADAVSVLEELAGDGPWSEAVEVFHGRGSSLALSGRPPGGYAYRVRHDASGVPGPWSAAVGVAVAGPAVPEVEVRERGAGLARVHAAVLEICAARGDVFAVLTTPATWQPQEVFGHAARVRSAASRATAGDHAAVYHPWLRAVGGAILPPDGAVLGQLSGLAARRGVWIGGADRALAGALAASSALGDAVRTAAARAGTNPLLQTPRGVLALSDQTLCTDPDLGRITTRRLLALLRRFAGQVGAELVFEVDDAVRRRMVRRSIEDQLSRWLARGAFAGTTPGDSYRVAVTGGDGRFVVEVGVAPSVPLRFLTVRLLGSGDGTITAEGV